MSELSAKLEYNSQKLYQSIQILDETHKIGTEIVTELKRQGEILDRINDDAEHIEKMQVESNKILISLSNIWERITSTFRNSISIQFKKIPLSSTKPLIKDVEKQHGLSLTSIKATEEQHKLYIESEMMLSQINDALSDLTNVAMEIGHELDLQNEKCDHLIGRLNTTNVNMKQLNKKIKSLS